MGELSGDVMMMPYAPDRSITQCCLWGSRNEMACLAADYLWPFYRNEMVIKRLLVELVFLGPFCILVWMYSDYGWIAAVVTVTILFISADVGGRWGSARADETARYKEAWLSKRKNLPPDGDGNTTKPGR